MGQVGGGGMVWDHETWKQWDLKQRHSSYWKNNYVEIHSKNVLYSLQYDLHILHSTVIETIQNLHLWLIRIKHILSLRLYNPIHDHCYQTERVRGVAISLQPTFSPQAGTGPQLSVTIKHNFRPFQGSPPLPSNERLWLGARGGVWELNHRADIGLSLHHGHLRAGHVLQASDVPNTFFQALYRAGG